MSRIRAYQRHALAWMARQAHGQLPRSVRWAVRVTAALALGAVIAAALLLALTPSAASAQRRAQQLMISTHAGDQPMTVMPRRIAAAVLAVEDHRFHQHPGLDVIAAGRMVGGLLTGQDEGGSTIEVQLAKLLYTHGRHNLGDQIEQAALAVKLDRRYPKSQILLMYLNTEYFGHGFYGVTAAAHGYFGTAPQDLNWAQAALLAGLLKAPTAYDPFHHPRQALARRQHVLQRLKAVAALTPRQVAAANQSGLQLWGETPG